MELKNIYCVGRNYVKHAAELGNNPPVEPMIFTKPTHSIVYADGSPIDFPANKGAIHYEIEIVLYIGKPVTANFHVDDVVTKMALGIDFTLRDIQTELKQKGYPWLLAKGFKHATTLTEFWEFPGSSICEKVPFSLQLNDEIAQQGQAQSMIFDFQNLLDYIHNTFGLGVGDVIFTGTPEGVGPIQHGDRLTMKWGQQEKGNFSIEM